VVLLLAAVRMVKAVVAAKGTSSIAVAAATVAASAALPTTSIAATAASVAATAASRMAARCTTAVTMPLVAADEVGGGATADAVLDVLDLMAMLIRQQVRVDLIERQIILDAERGDEGA
jgi:hypothetical protein